MIDLETSENYRLIGLSGPPRRSLAIQGCFQPLALSKPRSLSHQKAHAHKHVHTLI